MMALLLALIFQPWLALVAAAVFVLIMALGSPRLARRPVVVVEVTR